MLERAGHGLDKVSFILWLRAAFGFLNQPRDWGAGLLWARGGADPAARQGRVYSAVSCSAGRLPGCGLGGGGGCSCTRALPVRDGSPRRPLS